ncbi:MAG TPA: enoyl-CoA hydratase [Acidimicrobiia bacterium]|nr:enoyl-CoA hydratase [Acidimicrobiia bacterium]
MRWRHIDVSHEAPRLTITLSRPERRNALSLDLMTEVIKALREIPPEVRAVVVAAEGPAFSAGHDLSEMIDRPPSFYDDLFAVCTEMMESVQALPQPVIARVHGVATAAGCQLVASCDLAVASTEAWFGTPGVKIGLFCTTPAVPLVRAIGRKRAMEMLLTARAIDAQTAQSWGLVNRVVPPEELDAAVTEYVETIAGFSRHVIGLGKETFYRQADLPQREAYGVTQRVMADSAVGEQAQEGMSAFLDKRRPEWPD